GNEPIGADADNFRDEMLKSCDNMAKNSKVSAVFKKEYTAKDVKDFRANIKPDMDKYNEKKRLDKDLDKPKKSGMKK
ncbi:MAG: hypothetical protein IJ129_06340, partial [Ruminococcus sp.]|nr:hypothetical protein [Ruminococcus sp.]